MVRFPANCDDRACPNWIGDYNITLPANAHCNKGSALSNPSTHGTANRLDAGGLTVDNGLHTGRSALLWFDFARESAAAAPTGLAPLGGCLDSECWQSYETVETGTDGRLVWRRASTLMALSFESPDDGTGDLAMLSRDGYRRIIEVMRASGFGNLLRAWNYMPSINQGSGDSERYRQFCLGRGQALAAAGISENSLCAGTAIGTHSPGFRIHVLAGKQPGINIENPRQVSAFRYPRRYGPHSPSFARATALPRPGGSNLLMISGTASVVGHETAHPDNLEAQLEEVVVNIDSLLAQCARRIGTHAPGRIGRNSLLRAYVRHDDDWPQVREHLERAWPGVRLIGLHGDICRRDLLVEIEAVTET